VTPPSGKVIWWLAMHTSNWIQKPQELIFCHICIHKPRAYILPIVCIWRKALNEQAVYCKKFYKVLSWRCSNYLTTCSMSQNCRYFLSSGSHQFVWLMCLWKRPHESNLHKMRTIFPYKVIENCS
jgi:hypothetical protein